MRNTFKKILKWFVFIQSSHCNRLLLDEKTGWKGIEMLQIFVYRKVAVAHILKTRTESLKTFIVLAMWWSSKLVLLTETQKIALLRASMVVTYYIKLFRTGANRQNGILMSLILLVAETIMFLCSFCNTLQIKLIACNQMNRLFSTTIKMNSTRWYKAIIKPFRS